MKNKALQDLQAGRDPFAAARNEIHMVKESPQPFCRRAAKWAVWLPVIGGLLIYGGNSALQGVSGPVGLLGRLAIVAIFCVIEVASLILGTIALCGVREYGPDRLFWRGIRSVVFSLIALALSASFIMNLVRAGIENRRALFAWTSISVRARAHKPADDAPAKQPENPATAVTPPAQPALQTNAPPDPSLVAVPQATPDDPLVAKAAAACVQKMMGLAASYTSADRALQRPPVLDMSMITKREQVLARKDLVKKFLAANEKLEALTANGEEVFRKELALAHCTPEKTEATADAYRRSIQDRKTVLLKLRNADERRAAAMLGILEVMDSSFGQWKYDQEAKRLLFSDGGALHNYLSYREAMDSATADQKKLQTQVSPPLASL
jgi:hypothetical protein